MEQQGKRNAYVCEKCGGTIITVNLDEGVTSFMVTCRANWPGECDGMAQSQMYDVRQTIPASWGWYRPNLSETNRLEAQHPGMKEHIERGGLVLRKLDNAEREQHGAQRVRRG